MWETAIGTPGISGGYAAPIRAWNDGNGEKIYVGGSFTSAGGSSANRYLARWDAGTGQWSALGSGISGGFTNAFMTSIRTWNTRSGEQLVVGGFFDTAGGVPETASLAMWNGQTWSALGTGWTGTTRGSIWSMAEWNGRLYVGGGAVNQPAMIAGLPWAGMASWDGSVWRSHVTTSAGFSPNVFSLAVFDDGSGEALYAVGRFSSLDGIPGTSMIARWNGTAWSSVGGGLTPTTSTGGLEASVVFNDGSGPALYVAGNAFFGTGVSTTNVAKWNGTAWAAVGPQIGTGRITSLAVFDDGTGPTLYIGGTAMPQINQFARWRNSQWEIVDGGCTGPGNPPSNFPSVFGLGKVGSKLYLGGSFSQVNSLAAAGLAARTSCPPVCYANCDGSSIAPILNVSDFICFQTKYAAGDTYANCDGSTIAPILNVSDFICFQSQYAAGCS